MRLFRFPILLSALLLASGCHKSETDTGISPVPASDEINRYFEEHLPKEASNNYDLEFKFGEDSQIYRFDNIDDFSGFSKNGNVPDIDFEKNTLIVGQIRFGEPRYVFKNQSVQIESDRIDLTATFEELSGAAPCVETYLYFWGLYENLPDTPINLTTNILKKK